MAYEAINWAWKVQLPGKKNSTRKLVLIALADMADEEFSCFPGQDRLARMAECEVSTVGASLKYLERVGLLSRTRRYREGGFRTSDRYVLHVGAEPTPEEANLGSTYLGSTDPLPGMNVALTSGVQRAESPENHQKESPEGGWFEFVWQAWPKKDDKKDAQKRWPHAVREFGGTERQLASIALVHAEALRANREKKYQPGFCVWLNKARWNNEPVTSNRATTPTDANLSLVERLRQQEIPA